jgi:hypothetical protein
MNNAYPGSDSEPDTTGKATPPEPLAPPAPLAPPGASADPTVPVAAQPVAPPAPAGATASGAPAGPAAPAAPASTRSQPAVVGAATGLARRVGVSRTLGAVAIAAIVYLAAWIVSLVATLLSLVSASDASPDWGWAFEMPAQLVGLAVAGILTLSFTVMGVSADVSLVWLPLFITAVIVTGILLLSRRDERATPSETRGVRWVRSAATGLAFALLVLLIAAILPIRFQFDGGSDPYLAMLTASGSGSSVSFTAFLGALVIVTASGYVARASGATRTARADSPLRRAISGVLPSLGLYVAVASVLITVAIVITLIVRDGASTLLTFMLWLPTAILDGIGFINLVPVGLTGSAIALPGMSPSDTRLWMPADFPVWGTVIVLVVNLALIVATGVALALVRKNAGISQALRWGTTVVAFAAFGALAAILGSITVWTSLDTSAAGETLDGILGGPASGLLESVASVRLTVGLAAWTFIVFAILGALVEASATYLAPFLIPFVPASLIARASRFGGTAPVAAAGVSATDPAYATSGVAPVSADGTPGWAGATGTTAPVAGASSVPVTGVPPVTPMSPERKKKVRLILILIGAVLALVIAAAITISVVNNSVFSPKNQVESYLDNVIDGNAEAALDGVKIDSADTGRVLLNDDVLGATERGITGYSITDVEVSGDAATVTAEIDQDGEPSTQYFDVVRSGSEFLFFDDWSLGPQYFSSISLDLPETATSIIVNGVDVAIDPADLEYGYLSLPAFPGEYVVELGDTTEFLAAEAQSTYVSAGMELSPDPLSFALEPTQAFTDEVGKQIDDLVASCAAEGLIESDDCPLSWYAFGDVTNVVWTVVEPATFEIADYGVDEWYVETDDRGVANLTYTRDTTYSEPTDESDEVEYTVTGTVEIVDGKPVYTYGY